MRPCQNAVIKYNLTCFTAQGIESVNWNDSEMKMISKEDLIGQLKEKGLKITPQRLAIIDALVENRHAASRRHI